MFQNKVFYTLIPTHIISISFLSNSFLFILYIENFATYQSLWSVYLVFKDYLISDSAPSVLTRNTEGELVVVLVGSSPRAFHIFLSTSMYHKSQTDVKGYFFQYSLSNPHSKRHKGVKMFEYLHVPGTVTSTMHVLIYLNPTSL